MTDAPSTRPAMPAPRLSPAQQERFRLIETAMRAFREAPVEVLRARGIVQGGTDLPDFRHHAPRWFLAADDAAAVAFFLLVEEAHAASEAAIAAAPPPSPTPPRS